MRRILCLAVGLLMTPLLAREPLCRDLKGLYTPCTNTHRAPVAKPGSLRGEDPLRTDRPAPPRPSKTKPVTTHSGNHVKLCRDLKGLYTPCPR